jgi:hypothetical protein
MMNIATKLLLAAVPAMLAASPAMATVTADSDSLEINLNGEVQSVCFLTPDGPVTKTLNMANGLTPQQLVGIAYSCNSPYTVTLKSQNGGLKHNSAPFKVAYDVIIAGTGGLQSRSAQSLTGGVAIAQDTDWTNIALNGGAQALTFDLNFNGLTDYQVAGTYSDKLTVSIKADL